MSELYKKSEESVCELTLNIDSIVNDLFFREENKLITKVSQRVANYLCGFEHFGIAHGDKLDFEQTIQKKVVEILINNKKWVDNLFKTSIYEKCLTNVIENELKSRFAKMSINDIVNCIHKEQNNE